MFFTAQCMASRIRLQMNHKSEMATFIATYQTLVVGILGFVGVMATLAFNARLARRAEDRKITHEARALRTALVEERKVQRDALMHAADTSKQTDAPTKLGRNDALTPLHRWSDIFDKSIDKLGLLRSDEVATILDAYLPLKELTPKIRLLETRVPPDRRRVEYSEAAPQDYALVGHEEVKFLAELHSIYIPAFDEAIEKLSLNLR
jgi:hypothetical protein